MQPYCAEVDKKEAAKGSLFVLQIKLQSEYKHAVAALEVEL